MFSLLLYFRSFGVNQLYFSPHPHSTKPPKFILFLIVSIVQHPAIFFMLLVLPQSKIDDLSITAFVAKSVSVYFAD